MVKREKRVTLKSARTEINRGFWFMIGIGALGLGGIGIILPLLPTVPFVILAAFAFGKSSPRFQLWLLNSKSFGPIIDEWRSKGAIAPRYKAVAMIMMFMAIGASIWFQFPFYVLIIQAFCIAGASSFILTRPNG